MPIITRSECQAWAHCSAQLDADGAVALDSGGVPAGEERCPGFKQERVSAVRETVAYTYADQQQSASSDPMDAMVAQMVEHSVERLLWADETDIACPHCGSERALADQVRPVYQSLGGSRGGPDVLLADRRARREQTQAQQAAASAAERSAIALEQLAAGAGPDPEIGALRAEIAELREQLQQQNGHGESEPERRPSDVAPRPRRRSTTT